MDDEISRLALQNNIKKTKEGMLNEDFGVNRTNPKKKLKAEQPLKNRLKCLLQLLLEKELKHKTMWLCQCCNGYCNGYKLFALKDFNSERKFII
jgi:hypothetical protein